MPFHPSSDPNQRGALSAHLFENPSAGVRRGLFWSVTLPCLPVRWDEEDWDCSLTCDWLQWPVRNWIELDGASLATALEASNAECSVYLAEHHPVKLTSLTIRRIEDTHCFVVTVQGTLDVEGFDELDGESIPVNLESEVDFEYVTVVPANLTPKPANAIEALVALEPFIDTAEFQPPEWERFRYVLRLRLRHSDA
jgi:hypothetical protein